MNELRPKNYMPPFPYVGEVLRFIAAILETKPVGRDLDRLAREGDFDSEKVFSIADNVFVLPLPSDCVVVPIKSAEIIAQFRSYFLTCYLAFIRSNPVLGFSRQEVLVGLVRFSVPIVVDLLNSVLTNRVDLLKTFSNANKPIVAGMIWLSSEFQHEWGEYRSSLDKAGQDRTLRWMKGEQQPNASDLFIQLEKFIKEMKIKNDVGRMIFDTFMAVVILQNIYQLDTTGTIKEELRKNACVDTLTPPLVELLLEKIPQTVLAKRKNNVLPYIVQIEEAKTDLLNNQKERHSLSSELDSRITNIEKFVTLHEYEYLNWWQALRIRAIWLVFNGKLTEANAIYKSFMDVVCYTGDENQNNIFKESLVLASALDDRSFLKRLKHIGIVFDYFGKPIQSKESQANKSSRTTVSVVEDWEVLGWKSRFFSVFRKELFFIESPESLIPNISPSIYYLGPEDFAKKPDLAKPDSLITHQGKRYPQITWFTMLGNFTSTKDLIAAGANVNKLSDSGESALLFAIQFMNPDELTDYKECSQDSDLFELISSRDHSINTVSTPTNARKYTCLGCAVETGSLKVVDVLLGFKANPNQFHGISQQSPLYLATKLFPCKKLSLTSGEIDYEGLRRTVPFFRSLTIDEIAIAHQEQTNNPEYIFLMETYEQIINDRRGKRHSREGFLKIIDSLLKSGADPNQPHMINGIKGYTPLMMAAENNSLPVFELMIEHGGNPNITCNSFYFDNPVVDSCWEIAVRWRSGLIVKYLENNRDRFIP